MDFANGEDFAKFEVNLSALDLAMPISQKDVRSQTVWKRSGII